MSKRIDSCVVGRAEGKKKVGIEDSNPTPDLMQSSLSTVCDAVEIALHNVQLEVEPGVYVHPVCIPNQDGRKAGNVIFDLPSRPIDEYEGAILKLEVRARIKHRLPWYTRLWKSLHAPKKFDQQLPVDHGAKYVESDSINCPTCRNKEISQDMYPLEVELYGKEAQVRYCSYCHTTWYSRK